MSTLLQGFSQPHLASAYHHSTNHSVFAPTLYMVSVVLAGRTFQYYNNLKSLLQGGMQGMGVPRQGVPQPTNAAQPPGKNLNQDPFGAL